MALAVRVLQKQALAGRPFVVTAAAATATATATATTTAKDFTVACNSRSSRAVSLPSVIGRRGFTALAGSVPVKSAGLILGNCSSPRPFSSLVDEDGVVRSPYDNLDYPENMSLPMYVMEDWAKLGDRTAMIDAVTERRMTYKQLQDEVIKTASGFVRLGVTKNDMVTIFAPNCLEFPVFHLAIGITGAIVSPVNPAYTAGELEHAVNLAESKYIVTVPELIPTTKEAMAKCPTVKEIIVIGESEGCRPYSWFLEDDGKAFPSDVTIDSKKDLMALPFSSGTTGMPKGVMLTHYNILSNTMQTASDRVMRYSPDDVMIGILPMFHIYGQVLLLLGGLRAGSTIVVMPKFDAQLYLQSVSKYKASFLHIVPPIVLFLAKHPLVKQADFSSVHTLFTGAAPVGSKLMEEALRQTNENATFRQGYGLTEASPVTHINPIEKELIKFHTIGPAVHNTQYKIVDIESGKTLGEEEEGELLVRGPQVMKGYYKNDEATADTLKDGWLHTGDIGHYDKDGHVIITDRLKELIKHKGFQVAPAELEALLLTHPGVLDAAVIGKPDERAGELPRAYIVPNPNVPVTEEELKEFVEGKVASYKELSGGVEFREEIPKASSGKILRRVLKEELKKETEQ